MNTNTNQSLIAQIQETVGVAQKQLLDHDDGKTAQMLQWIMDLDPTQAPEVTTAGGDEDGSALTD
jgi:hypothetical protein